MFFFVYVFWSHYKIYSSLLHVIHKRAEKNLYGAPCSLLAFTFAFLCRVQRHTGQTQHEECWEIACRHSGGQFVVQHD